MEFKTFLILTVLLGIHLFGFSQNTMQKDQSRGDLIVRGDTLIILHAGSGPTDRDGNQPYFQPHTLKLLSEKLSESNYSIFRYDKLGSGKSMDIGDPAKLTIDTYVDDLKEWIIYFTSEKFSFNTIIIVGHSEGALIGQIHALKHPELIQGLICLTPTGINYIDLLRKQLTTALDSNSNVIVQKLISDILEDKEVIVPAWANSFAHPTAHNFLRSVSNIDPIEYFKQIQTPFLIVSAGSDGNIQPGHGYELFKSSFDTNTVLIENMNHHLQKISAGEVLASKPNIHNELVETILQFIKRL
jgi:pimeloyl-ACP methyl ester carboxylesterase